MEYTYGKIMLEDENIETLEGWTDDTEMAFSIMDSRFDYLWNYNFDGGKIRFIDRLYNDFKGEEQDNTYKDREKKGTLELEFDNFTEAFEWMINTAAETEDDWYDWVAKRVEKGE